MGLKLQYLCQFYVVRAMHIYLLKKLTVAQETAAAPNNADKKVIPKNCDPFTSCISRINNAQVDDAQYIVVVMLPLKYLSNFWRTLEMLLITCEITVDLNWSENCVIAATNVTAQVTKISITDAKRYVPVVTLSAQDNAKLLEQLKSGFKRTINWNIYQQKVSTERPYQYLDFLIDPSFQGVNRLFF